jgi:hypothetical protein
MKNLYESIKNVVSDLEEAAPKASAKMMANTQAQKKIQRRLDKNQKQEKEIQDRKPKYKMKKVNEVSVKSMDHDKALKVYEKLKKGSKVTAEFGNAMSVNNKPIELVVSSPHRIVGKSKVGRIFLKNPDGKGVKYTLFNRDGKISLAQGDMGTILKDLKIVKESVNEEMDPTDHVVKKDGCYCVMDVNGKTVKKFDDKKEADAYAIKFHDKLMGRE